MSHMPADAEVVATAVGPEPATTAAQECLGVVKHLEKVANPEPLSNGLVRACWP